MNWYFKDGEAAHGPYTSTQLKKLATDGTISRRASVRKGESGRWHRADSVRNLFPVASTPAAECHAESKVEREPPKNETTAAQLASTPPSPNDLSEIGRAWALHNAVLGSAILLYCTLFSLLTPPVVFLSGVWQAAFFCLDKLVLGFAFLEGAILFYTTYAFLRHRPWAPALTHFWAMLTIPIALLSALVYLLFAMPEITFVLGRPTNNSTDRYGLIVAACGLIFFHVWPAFVVVGDAMATLRFVRSRRLSTLSDVTDMLQRTKAQLSMLRRALWQLLPLKGSPATNARDSVASSEEESHAAKSWARHNGVVGSAILLYSACALLYPAHWHAEWNVVVSWLTSVFLVLAFLGGVILLYTTYGFLNHQPWALTLTYFWTLQAIAFGFLSTFVYLLFVLPEVSHRDIPFYIALKVIATDVAPAIFVVGYAIRTTRWLSREDRAAIDSFLRHYL